MVNGKLNTLAQGRARARRDHAAGRSLNSGTPTAASSLFSPCANAGCDGPAVRAAAVSADGVPDDDKGAQMAQVEGEGSAPAVSLSF